MAEFDGGQYLRQVLPAQINKDRLDTLSSTVTIQFAIENHSDLNCWYELGPQKFEVHAGVCADAQLHLQCGLDVLQEIAEGTLKFDNAFSSGRLSVQGNYLLLLSLADLFQK